MIYPIYPILNKILFYNKKFNSKKSKSTYKEYNNNNLLKIKVLYVYNEIIIKKHNISYPNKFFKNFSL